LSDQIMFHNLFSKENLLSLSFFQRFFNIKISIFFNLTSLKPLLNIASFEKKDAFPK
jgi:hypothetical protein